MSDGACLLFRKGEIPANSDLLTGQRIVVVSGTTTEKALEALGASAKLGAALVRVPDHGAALKALNDKQATAYAADRTVLVTTALVGGDGKEFELSSAQFTYEPYGLMMRIDPALRLAVASHACPSLSHRRNCTRVSTLVRTAGEPGRGDQGDVPSQRITRIGDCCG